MRSLFKSQVVFIFLFFITATAAAVTTRQQSELLKNKLKTARGHDKVETLLKLASLYQSDSTHLTIRYSRQAIAESDLLHDKYSMAKAYVRLASLFLRTRITADSAAFYLNAAEKAYASSPSGKPDAGYFYYLASYHLRNRDTIRAVAMSQIALEKTGMENDNLTAALAAMMLGSISQKNRDIQGLVEWLGKAEKSFMLSEEKYLAGPAMISLGIMYNDAGLHQKGDMALINAIALCEQNGDSLYLAYLYCNVAGIFQSGPDADKTLHFLKKAESIFQSLNDDKGMGYALNHLGMYYRDHGKPDEAIICFSKAITGKIRAGDWQGACFAACNKAEAYMDKRDYDETTAAFREAEQWMIKAEDKLSAAVYYNSYGKFLIQNKEYSDALKIFNESLRNARECLNHDLVAENLQHIADLHQLLGNGVQALKYYKTYIAARDSVREALNVQHDRDMQSELTMATRSSSDEKPSSRHVLTGLNDATIPAVFMIIIVLMAFSFRRYRIRTTEKHEKETENQPANSTVVSPEADEEDQEDVKNVRRALSDEISDDIFQNLIRLMEAEKYFLRSELSLHELAMELETNTSYLSRVINERTGGNFHSLLNKYRIEEACRLLSDQKQQYLSIEGIALSAGFKSKSAFNAAFRKFKGMTPSQFCMDNPSGDQ